MNETDFGRSELNTLLSNETVELKNVKETFEKTLPRRMNKSNGRHDEVYEGEWYLYIGRPIERENGICTLVNLLRGRKAIGIKWVLKIKLKTDDTIEHSKARVIAKGYTEHEIVDYKETFLTHYAHGHDSLDSGYGSEFRPRTIPNGC